MSHHISVDFTNRVFFNDRRNLYLLVGDGAGFGRFLTMENGIIELKNVERSSSDPTTFSEFIKVKDRLAEAKLIHLPGYEDKFFYALKMLNDSYLNKDPKALAVIDGLMKGTLQPGKLVDEKRVRLAKAKRVKAEKPAKAKAKKGQVQATTTGGEVSLEQLCLELGIEPRAARGKLRRAGVEKPGSRWAWSPNQVASIRKVLG